MLLFYNSSLSSWICYYGKNITYIYIYVNIPLRRKWQPTPILLPGEFHGQRNLGGYGPWDRKDSDTTE